MKQSDSMITVFINRNSRVLLVIIATVFLMYTTSSLWCTPPAPINNGILSSGKPGKPAKYPLTDPIRVSGGGIKYRIGVISDLDKDRSKVPGKPFAHRSYYKTGYLLKDGTGKYRWVMVIPLLLFLSVCPTFMGIIILYGSESHR